MSVLHSQFRVYLWVEQPFDSQKPIMIQIDELNLLAAGIRMMSKTYRVSGIRFYCFNAIGNTTWFQYPSWCMIEKHSKRSAGLLAWMLYLFLVDIHITKLDIALYRLMWIALIVDIFIVAQSTLKNVGGRGGNSKISRK